MEPIYQNKDFQTLARQFDGPGVKAIVLMGSYARGNPGVFSDVDLVRFTDEQSSTSSEGESHLIDGRLVVVSTVGPKDVEKWFTRPEVSVNVIAGIRSARPLVDRDSAFAAIQARARSFVWDAAMQEGANAWASEQLVGWIEEVHKGLQGLQSDDIGRLLNARFGLSWGLSNVIKTQRGILISGDNAFYDEIAEAVGRDSKWTALRKIAYGIEDESGNAPTLRRQVIAGLRLYVETVRLLKDALHPAHKPLIEQTVEQVNQVLVE